MTGSRRLASWAGFGNVLPAAVVGDWTLFETGHVRADGDRHLYLVATQLRDK